MAKEFRTSAGGSRRSAREGSPNLEVQEIPLESIDSSDCKYQYRFAANVGDLRRSLSSDGQKEPVDLLGGRPHTIVDGFRRIEAARDLGWKTIKAFVHIGMTAEEAHKLAFIKNVVRKNLSPMDKANAIYQARQRGRTTEDLTEAFGLSEKQLRRYESLLSIGSRLQALLDREAISISHAKHLSDFRVKEGDLETWVDRIRGNRWTAKQLKRELKKALGTGRCGRSRLYMRKERNGIRMYPFSLSKDAPKPERQKVVKLLKEAIDLLES